MTYAGYDVERARELIAHFKQFIEAHKDSLAALQILLNRPYRARHLTYAAIKELADELTRAPWPLEVLRVWQAYQRLEATRVRGAPEKVLTDLIALVRFATGGPMRSWSRSPAASSSASTSGSAASSRPAAASPPSRPSGSDCSRTTSPPMPR